MDAVTGSFAHITGSEIALEIEALGNTLIDVYVAETGLAEGRALGERGRTIGQLHNFAELLEEGSYVNAVIETADPNRSPIPKPDIRTLSRPLGPIAVFGSSNFPLAFSTAGGDTASALAAGCPVVVKCHPFHAGTSELVAGAIVKAATSCGMPDGVFSHLLSKDHRVGSTLVSHPGIKGVGFTGSINGGMALNKLAQQREEPIPFFAEMGSVNPVVVLPNSPDSVLYKWAEDLAGSIVLGAGQFCTNPGLILGVNNPAFEKFIGKLGNHLKKRDPQCMLHPAIHDQFKIKAYTLKNEPAVKLVTEVPTDTPNFAKNYLYRVNASEFLDNPKLHQEVFGPLSLVVVCENEEALLNAIQALEGQLTGTLLGEEQGLAANQNIVRALREKVGRLIFNGVPTGVEVNHAMHHGGPFPASTDSRFTSVGQRAIQRWLRPVCYQNWPEEALPEVLKDSNPHGITRMVNGEFTSDSISSP